MEPGVLRVCARLLLVPVHGDLGPGAGLEVPAPRRQHLIGTRRVSPGFIVASTSSLQLFIKTCKTESEWSWSRRIPNHETVPIATDGEAETISL